MIPRAVAGAAVVLAGEAVVAAAVVAGAFLQVALELWSFVFVFLLSYDPFLSRWF